MNNEGSVKVMGEGGKRLRKVKGLSDWVVEKMNGELQVSKRGSDATWRTQILNPRIQI